MYQQLLKTANRKKQNTDTVLLFVENCDVKLEIFNKLTHLNQSQILITVMSDLFFCEGFSVVHVIMTTIISNHTFLFQHVHLGGKYAKNECHNQAFFHKIAKVP